MNQARERLAAAGAGTVEVVLGDRALGHTPGAPFDRIVATVGAYGIPESWLSQLAPAGRLVGPCEFVEALERAGAGDELGGGQHTGQAAALRRHTGCDKARTGGEGANCIELWITSMTAVLMRPSVVANFAAATVMPAVHRVLM